MADPSLGFVQTRQRAHVQVIAKDDGGVSLVDLRTLAAVDLDGENRDALRELLGRAAVPGRRVRHGPACGCAPCKAGPGYAARRAGAHGQAEAAHDSGERMAADPDGTVKPVSEFTPDEKWWCDGEDCDGEDCDLPGTPHVHPMHGPALPVDLLTGRTATSDQG